jgi:glutathione S-transferase
MTAKLYSLALSHPSHAARLMLELKGVDHEVVDLLPGVHPVQLRAYRFRRGTVPALKVDGQRVQGSVPISRFLERLTPLPPLFPDEPASRRAVEEAEAWGEKDLQPIPRRIFRWGTVHAHDLRRWLAELSGIPAPDVAVTLSAARPALRAPQWRE